MATNNCHNLSGLAKSVGRIPSGLFILTAAHDGRRSGVLVKWVQQCSIDPPLISLAIPKGEPVEPLIRDSRFFALCQIGADDRFLHRKFARTPDRTEDPFVTIVTHTGITGSPIPERAMSYIECEVVRHIDLETAFRLYVGEVKAGDVIGADAPLICLRDNGLTH